MSGSAGDVITPTGSITGDSTTDAADLAGAVDFFAADISVAGSIAPAFRCFARPVSLASFFVAEGRDVRDLEFASEAGVLFSGAVAMDSCPIFRIFFEVLLDCMHAITP